jgi:hypothetical protein
MEHDLINKENERLLQGKEVIVTFLDNHQLHIKHHADLIKSVRILYKPSILDKILYKLKLKKEPNYDVNPTLNHIQEHIDLLKNVGTL